METDAELSDKNRIENNMIPDQKKSSGQKAPDESPKPPQKEFDPFEPAKYYLKPGGFKHYC